ncbi:hypothetical protein V9T40_012739 [Parthenolecanium corni]|uniref:Meiotic nuclear division protein 1 homolog n=1 Tax=Parthenolecanium corni TaxID=536013 RepID=A0AAN9Y0V0_9HEMI
MNIQLNTIQAVIVATAILHNIARELGDDEPVVTDEIENDINLTLFEAVRNPLNEEGNRTRWRRIRLNSKRTPKDWRMSYMTPMMPPGPLKNGASKFKTTPPGLSNEIEKIASKEKGINAQLVKDIVQNLVDDGLVDSDKIGTSVFFWSYPSKALNTKKRKLEELTSKIEETSKKLKSTSEKLEEVKVNNEDTEEKSKIFEEIQTLALAEKDLKEKLELYANNDPELFQNKKDDTKKFLEAANRWTDNIFEIKSWCKRKFMIEESLLDKQFNIPRDLDYINL